MRKGDEQENERRIYPAQKLNNETKSKTHIIDSKMKIRTYMDLLFSKQEKFTLSDMSFEIKKMKKKREQREARGKQERHPSNPSLDRSLV